ncbi:MAG: response regulator [Bacteroidetes bacterium]|nr:response regulator [Bacteroidota bacterium]
MRKRVLIVEDDFFVRTLLNFLLKEQFEVVSVENGHRGLIWMDKGNLPDLILSDIDMPQLDGFDLLEHLRRSGYYRDIPVIMLTGFDDEQTKSKCLSAGAANCLTKPFNPPDLLEAINTVLNNKTIA